MRIPGKTTREQDASTSVNNQVGETEATLSPPDRTQPVTVVHNRLESLLLQQDRALQKILFIRQKPRHGKGRTRSKQSGQWQLHTVARKRTSWIQSADRRHTLRPGLIANDADGNPRHRACLQEREVHPNEENKQKDPKCTRHTDKVSMSNMLVNSRQHEEITCLHFIDALQ